MNPYEAGQAHQQGYVDRSLSMSVTPLALSSLIRTKFWVSLVGFAMLVLTGLSIFKELFYVGIGSNTSLLEWIPVIVLFVLQIILAVRLVQYGRAIGRLEVSRDDQDFERAMDVHTKFWRLAGILIIVGVVLVIVMIIFAMFAFRGF